MVDGPVIGAVAKEAKVSSSASSVKWSFLIFIGFLGLKIVFYAVVFLPARVPPPLPQKSGTLFRGVLFGCVACRASVDPSCLGMTKKVLFVFGYLVLGIWFLLFVI
jgi:hypothetical protein